MVVTVLLQRPLLLVGRPVLVINAAAYSAVDWAETEFEMAMSVNGHAVGAMAQVSLQEGLHRTVAWYLSHKALWQPLLARSREV
jgi:hypothetical protein